MKDTFYMKRKELNLACRRLWANKTARIIIIVWWIGNVIIAYIFK